MSTSSSADTDGDADAPPTSHPVTTGTLVDINLDGAAEINQANASGDFPMTQPLSISGHFDRATANAARIKSAAQLAESVATDALRSGNFDADAARSAMMDATPSLSASHNDGQF